MSGFYNICFGTCSSYDEREVSLSYKATGSSTDSLAVVEVVPYDGDGDHADVTTVQLTAFQVAVAHCILLLVCRGCASLS